MGEVPDGFKAHPGLDMFGNQSGLLADGDVPAQLPNGVDFWWDEQPTSDNNCWFGNAGPDGTRDSLTGDPPLNPVAGTSLAGLPARGLRDGDRHAPLRRQGAAAARVLRGVGDADPARRAVHWYESRCSRAPVHSLPTRRSTGST